MDDLDHALLVLLEDNARSSVSTLAHKTGAARSTVQNRIERMERDHVIAGYTVKLGDPTHRRQITSVVLLQLDPHSHAEAIQRLLRIPNLYRLCTTSGRFDMLLELRCSHTEELDQILDNIGKISGVRSSESLIVLSNKRG